MDKQAKLFIKEYEDKVVELAREANVAYFNATVTGDKKEFERVSDLQLKLSKVLSNKDEFEKLKQLKNSNGDIYDSLKRQIDLIYNEYAGNQFDEKLHKEIVALSTKIETQYSLFRAKFGEQYFTDNEIDDILINSTDDTELRNAWEASKDIGEIVADDVVNLVVLRNKAASSLGYKNYHSMSLELSEQSSVELDVLFDELDDLTSDKFNQLKNEIDDHLSRRLSISKKELMPWHYQDKYFQQGPKIYKVDFDKYFKDIDVAEICREYFNGVGLNIDDIIERSDLYEKENKYQHAYCSDMDRSGDIRIVCNIKPNHKWMSTILHESGHAAYNKYVDPKLPWQVRTHSHIFTTESIAMLFGRLASSPSWLKDVLNISENEKNSIREASFNSLMLEQLTFSRWVQVMYRFEKELYENPRQDLNNKWWELVEKYQLIKKPEGRNRADWASKIHIALYPAYYHNYMLGELLASQLYYHILENLLGSDNNSDESFNGRENIGEFLKKNFFSYGSKYRWNELIKIATGEPLTAKYYARQFVKY